MWLRRSVAALAIAASASVGVVTADAHSMKYRGDTVLDRIAYTQKVIKHDKTVIRAIETMPMGMRRTEEPNQLSRSLKLHHRQLKIVRRTLKDAKRDYAEWKRQKAAAMATITSSGGGSPITFYIIKCESGGDGNPYNYGDVNEDSGARGRYQLMPEHYEPGGACADLDWSPAGQDECASRLWDGGKGAGNWSQCL